MQKPSLFSTRLLPAITLSIVVLFSTVHGQEHPKEHPSGIKKEATLSPETLAREITRYIETESNLKGGYFLYYDDRTNNPLVLKLDHVHKDNLSKVADGSYFACSDFKSKDGKTYDLDFVLTQTDSGLHVTEITVHKEDGVKRYGWVEEEGIWKRQEK